MRVALAAIVALVPALVSAQQTPRAPDAPVLAIVDVTVVDAERGVSRQRQTVVVRGERIEAVGPLPTTPVPAGARVVNGAGGYLIPGLWDLHVHALRNGRAQWMFPLFVAAGVLGVRDTGSPLDSLEYYRAAIAEERLLGPRVIGSGPLLDGPPPQWPDFSVTIRNADDARRVVDSLAAGGADFVKVYDALSRDAFFAIAARARERGLRVAGHVPESVTPVEASDAGMWSIEHLTVAPACIPELGRIVSAAMAAASRPGVGRDSILAIRLQTDRRAIAGFDERACAEAGAALARNHTWLVPTLARERTWSRAYLASAAAGADPELRYVPAGVRAKWDRWRDSTVAVRTPAEAATEPDRYRLYLRIVGALRAAGVGVLPGTDTDGNDAFYYGVPGSTLHAELETLVGDAGFTPGQALRAATVDAARFLGVADSLGTIEPGRLAELVLLDASPLADVRNLRRIRAVVRGGRLLDRAAIDALLATRARAMSSDNAPQRR